MPCAQLPHNNSKIFINIGILDAALNLATHPKLGANLPAPAMFKGLFDTGAEKTMISRKVVTQLKLKPVGKIAIQGVGQNIEYHDGHLFHVAFTQIVGPPIPIPVPPGAHQVALMVHALPAPIHGGVLGFDPSDFDVLVGMDVISVGSFKVERGIASWCW